MHKTWNEVTRNQVFSPGDVAKVGVKSSSIVGPEEVAAAVVALLRGEGGVKSIFVVAVVVVGPLALLQPCRFIKYRATLWEGCGDGEGVVTVMQHCDI